MTQRYLIILKNAGERARAKRWIDGLPDGSRLEFKRPRRTLDQNSKLWAMLTDVSEKHPYHGRRLSPESWKLLFLNALKREIDVVPNLDGTGLVQISGYSSSDLSKDEFSELIELISAYAAKHGIEMQEAA